MVVKAKRLTLQQSERFELQYLCDPFNLLSSIFENNAYYPRISLAYLKFSVPHRGVNPAIKCEQMGFFVAGWMENCSYIIAYLVLTASF